MNRFYLLKRAIKYWLQKLFRGYSDKDTWNLDYTLAEWFVPRLKLFRKLHTGYPCDITEEKWNTILDEMIEGFESVAQQQWGDEATSKKQQRAFELLKEWHFHLWW